MRVLGGILIALPFAAYFVYALWDTDDRWGRLRVLLVTFGVAVVATGCVVAGAFLMVGGR